jgi:hypothetical protein
MTIHQLRCSSGSAGLEAEEEVWCCMVISIDRWFGFMLFPSPFHRRCLLSAQPSIPGVSRLIPATSTTDIGPINPGVKRTSSLFHRGLVKMLILIIPLNGREHSIVIVYHLLVGQYHHTSLAYLCPDKIRYMSQPLLIKD